MTSRQIPVSSKGRGFLQLRHEISEQVQRVGDHLVIGGAGKMGGWFVDFYSQEISCRIWKDASYGLRVASCELDDF